MADSDDEYDRRRARDKFRRERSDYQERRDDRNRRDERTDRGTRREYRDYDSQRRRERYSPLHHDVSPPVKRIRRDWDDRRRLPGYDLSYPLGGGNMMGGPPHGGWAGGMPQDMGMMHNHHGFGSHQGPQRDIEKPITQPPMMTFKQFLGSQDDRIDDQEAVKKYNEYKLEFRRQQINEFFLNHKEEEWFKSKYHPEEFGKRLSEQRAALKKRLEVFMELLDKNSIDDVNIDSDKSDSIVHLLDAVVIKLEGGSDFDLKVLDEPPEEEKINESEPALPEKKEEKLAEKEEKEAAPQEEKEMNSPKPRRKRTRNYSSDDDSSVDSESEIEPIVLPKNDDETEHITLNEDTESKKEEEKQKSNEEEIHSEKGIGLEEKSTIEKPQDTKMEIVEEEKECEKELENEGKEENKSDNIISPEVDVSKEKEPRPRPLHKTKSVFLRNLAPTIAKQEVEAMCKRYSGLLRVAISDPQPERRFFRRGWVTFERTVNIKEICWNLNNIRLRDCELGAIVNRDLSRRVRSVNGITAHKQVVLADIKLATRMIQNLDEQRNLWEDPATKHQKEQNFGLVSRNPLLKNITDYLIEEASAEEEELLGMSEKEENKQGEDNDARLERDETLIKVLDRLLLYLRIVHSVDYYNHCEYANEDEMPNRCGIIHARGLPPSTKVTQREINDYISQFEQKSAIFLQPQVKLGDEEALILGKKDPIVEVEKFVQANTQELAKDKWLCPLSGKKFKGSEFVRKHIFNKHSVKVEEVRKEVKYFNNYLIDPKRPQLPPHPSNYSLGSGPGTNRDEMYPLIPSYHGGANGSYPPSPYNTSYGVHRGFQNKGSYGGPFGGRSNFGSGFGKRSSYGRRSDSREVVGYHDLDKPQELEMP